MYTPVEGISYAGQNDSRWAMESAKAEAEYVAPKQLSHKDKLKNIAILSIPVFGCLACAVVSLLSNR